MIEEKSISLKNYFILAIVLIISIVLVIYFYMWYNEFELNRKNTPILDEFFYIINYNELEDYLIENKNVILYVSTLDDKFIRKFENKLRTVLDDYSFNKNILYMDLTSLKSGNGLYQSILNKYSLINLPCVVVFNNGNIIDSYSVVDNNYDIELLISYLRIKGVLDD